MSDEGNKSEEDKFLETDSLIPNRNPEVIYNENSDLANVPESRPLVSGNAPPQHYYPSIEMPQIPSPDDYPYPEYPPQVYPPQIYPPAPNAISTQPSIQNNPSNPSAVPEPQQSRTRSQYLICPRCNIFVWSRTDLKIGVINWLCCSYLCLIGCWGCCCLTFYYDSCKDVNHYCPQCNTVLKIETPQIF
jgi:lipopolysaccharide-induced tumor necrosis factor-alpha factor